MSLQKPAGVRLPQPFPPVLMVAAYDENGKVNAMNAAWGMICDTDKLILFLDEEHRTTKNIRISGAFTVSLADRAHVDAADFFGLASGNRMPDKFRRSGCHAVKSAHVNAPVIQEFPLAMECELAEVVDTPNVHAIVGRIVNVSVDEKALDDTGKVDPRLLDALTVDQFQGGYYAVGELVARVGQAGRGLLK